MAALTREGAATSCKSTRRLGRHYARCQRLAEAPDQLAKALDAFAAAGPESAPAGEIPHQINLGSDVLKFDKSIAPDPNDVDPFNDIGTAPMVASIAARNQRRAAVATLFERLAQERPPQTPQELTPPLAQTLINWLQRGWIEPTISAREFTALGLTPSGIGRA